MPVCDILIKNGEVIDPASGVRAKMDVAISGDRIVSIAPGLDPAQAVQTHDASDMLIAPGLIDLHTHLGFELHRKVVAAEDVCPQAGVTAAVDMGSVGAFTFPWYRQRVLETCPVRLFSFINISSIGTIAIHQPYYVNYYADGVYLDKEETARTIDENRDYILGIKVFGTATMAGEWVLPALSAAREVADLVKVPIAVHVSKEPPPLDDILALLRQGDMITHTYTPLEQGILDADGKVRAVVRDARERGVLFDLGHGSGSFTFDTARRAMEQGFLPDTISTDVYYSNVDGPVKDLPTTMGKFLALGLPLNEVLSRVTIAPAKAMGRPDLGSLREGGPADLSVLALHKGRFDYIDSRKQIVEGSWRVECELTVCRGQLIYQKESAHD